MPTSGPCSNTLRLFERALNARLEDNMTNTKDTITEPEEFLELSGEQLDNIFRNAPAGAIPIGQGDGTAIIAPGTVVSDTIAKFVHIFTWKGKVFEPDPVDSQRATLENRLFLLGTKAIVAQVYRGESWLDAKECIVLDYSHTSIVAQWIRDEIREVSPGLYLGVVYWGKEKPHAYRLIHFALKF
jgi:hypothetical protein